MAALLYTMQANMIYYPQKPRGDWRQLPQDRLTRLEFLTAQGPQVSWYIGDKGAQPRAVWVVFCGNGTLALDWVEYFADVKTNPGIGYLLVDYPGYGESAGKPSPSTILDASEGAVDALAGHLGITPQELSTRLNVLGHSLGCAAGLQFAVRHPVRGVVLFAPFTSTPDMASRMLTPIFNWVLTHQFDNRARLGELATRPNPPEVLLLHGDADTVIPVTMGREMAARYPHMIHYVEVPGGGHNSILDDRIDEVVQFVNHQSEAP